MDTTDIIWFTILVLAISYWIIESASKSRAMKRQSAIQIRLMVQLCKKAGVSEEDINRAIDQKY